MRKSAHFLRFIEILIFALFFIFLCVFFYFCNLFVNFFILRFFLRFRCCFRDELISSHQRIMSNVLVIVTVHCLFVFARILTVAPWCLMQTNNSDGCCCFFFFLNRKLQKSLLKSYLHTFFPFFLE